MNRPTLSAYLVEDEPLCRADFRQMLRSFPEICLVGETDTLGSARNFLGKHPVDILFLDLSVGRENGLDLIEQLPRPPLVIALTAHPQHAARGFTLNLVDYILKPVEEDRLRVALNRVHHRHAAAPLQPGKITFVAEFEGKTTTLELAEILGAEAMGNYVLLHTPRGKAIKRATFQHVENKLPPALFLRTGRGRIVARSSIREWGRNSDHHLVLYLSTGEIVRVSRSQGPKVLRLLKQNPPS